MEPDIRPMLDTICMTTEHLTSQQYEHINSQLQARYGVSTATGEVAYIHYVATIAAPGTGSAIRLTVRTSKWVKRPGEKQPYKVQGLNSFRVECSIHKSMHGHNVYGGPTEPQESIAWTINLVTNMLDVELPNNEHWLINRLDTAESFDLGSLENVRGWIRSKSLVIYPRRQVEFWGDLGFRVPGTTTTLKAYAKGPQFHSEGGYKALLQCRDAGYAFEVARLADRILRCEVEIKQATFDKMKCGGRAHNLTEQWVRETMYEEQWRQFLRPVDSDSRMVHTAVEVESRLRSVYDDAGRVLGLYLVWCVLAVRGEGWYRTQVAGSTWRKQRAALEKAYISWESTNILTIDCPSSLQTFWPSLSDPRRNGEILPLIAALAS